MHMHMPLARRMSNAAKLPHAKLPHSLADQSINHLSICPLLLLRSLASPLLSLNIKLRALEEPATRLAALRGII